MYVCSLARGQTDTKVKIEDTLSGFQFFFFKFPSVYPQGVVPKIWVRGKWSGRSSSYAGHTPDSPLSGRSDLNHQRKSQGRRSS